MSSKWSRKIHKQPNRASKNTISDTVMNQMRKMRFNLAQRMKRHHLKRGGYVEKKSTHFIPKAIKYVFGTALAGTATTIVGLGPLPGMAVHALFYCGEAEATRQKQNKWQEYNTQTTQTFSEPDKIIRKKQNAEQERRPQQSSIAPIPYNSQSITRNSQQRNWGE